MQIVVTDANIFIDLLEVQAIAEFFALPFEICTTDFVYAEIVEEKHRELLEAFKRSKKLRVYSFTPEEMMQISTLQTQPSLKRIADRSVFWKAQELHAMMLTGDRSMRKVGEAAGLEVHGILWVVECLVRETIIAKETAIAFLHNLQTLNPWLPEKEVEETICRL